MLLSSGAAARATYVIRSFLSFSFFRPPNAILVPGMYFLGFSRYSNCIISWVSGPCKRGKGGNKTPETTHQRLLIPDNALLLVGIRVLEALDQARLASEQAVEVRANLVGATCLEGVALGTTGFEQIRTLGVRALGDMLVVGTVLEGIEVNIM